MIKHIVMWKFRPGTETEARAFLDGLRGLYRSEEHTSELQSPR